MKTRCALFLALLISAPLFAEEPITISVLPDTVLIVPEGNSQTLNFDFVVQNNGQQPLAFESIRMAVFDDKGTFLTAREINTMGMAPSILTLPHSRIEPGKSVVAFNPFYEFPQGVQLRTLLYDFTLVEAAVKEGEEVQPARIHKQVVVQPTTRVQATRLSLPLKGPVHVSDGWDFYSHHRRVDVQHPMVQQLGFTHNPTRYGIDFMKVDANGSTYKGSGEQLSDYYIYGETVYAPAAGTVVDCVDGRAEGPIGKMNVDYDALMRTKDGRLLGGNYIILDHGNGEFSFFAHLKPGSLKVQKGDRVAAMQAIGQVGDSGDSGEPHLHYQLQSGAGFDVETLPAVFRNFQQIYGSRSVSVDQGTVNTGATVVSQ